jgi:hypothetical protein
MSRFTIANGDYQRARQKAMLNRLVGTITLKPYSLVSLAEAKQGQSYTGQGPAGMQQVLVECIVGTVGRSQDFDKDFNPLNDATREKWQSIDEAFHNDVGLPAVVLHRVGDHYYVEDGHHRVSVAKHHGVAYIDAEVLEYICMAQDAQEAA